MDRTFPLVGVSKGSYVHEGTDFIKSYEIFFLVEDLEQHPISKTQTQITCTQSQCKLFKSGCKDGKSQKPKGGDVARNRRVILIGI